MRCIVLLVAFYICAVGVVSCSENKRTPMEDNVNNKEVNDIFVDFGRICKLPNITLIDVNNKEVKLFEEVGEIKFVLYLPELGCASCSEKELQILNTVLKQKEKSRSLVIGIFANRREQFLFQERCGIRTLRLKNVEKNFPLPACEAKSIAFFIVNNGIGTSFFNMTVHGQYSDIYYRNVSDWLRDYN